MSNEHSHSAPLLDKSEKLGVIGSPSSTAELALDILGHAVGRKLVGELAAFSFQQDDVPNYALGQITEVQLRNVWHEDPTIRSLIRQRGRVDAVSERQDTHLGKMTVSSVFKQNAKSQFEPSILGTVPPTGTTIHIVEDEVLNRILAPYRETIFYLGHVYGSKPKLPLWFKHFDHGPDGAGEAYHLGIFGKTGSGKSVLAKMILLAYARHPKMALLVIDPQGEFSKDVRGAGRIAGFALPLGEILERFRGRGSVIKFSLRKMILDTWDLFQEILAESSFFRELQVLTQDKVSLACEQLVAELKKKDIRLASLHEQETFAKVWDLLKSERLRNKIYAREGAAAERFADAIEEADPEDLFRNVWSPVANLFKEDRESKRKRIGDAMKWLLADEDSVRRVLIVDVSREQAHDVFWNDRIQALVIKRILDVLSQTAKEFYQEDKSLNTLVVIDEAHRFAPRAFREEDEMTRQVRIALVDGVRTTRKYGLGWMFISQTLSSVDPSIVQQLRIFFFGFGLGLGQEFESLRQLAGSSGTALDLYQLFRDPQSAFDSASRQYSFMTVGPVSPLSFSGSPLFFNAFNSVDDFLKANGFKTEDGKASL